MKEAITKRQKELLGVIYGHIKNTGYPPTFEEMKEKLDVVSNQSILDLLLKLEHGRLIKKQVGAARGIVIKPKGYEVLNKPSMVAAVGVTAAGPFMEAVEITGEWQAVSNEVSKFQDDVYILKISGDSMINAGINEGDLVLVQKKKEFYTGDIVVAQIPDGTTVKRFISNDTPPYVYLKPENSNYKNIRFTEEMRMEGKVISIFKHGHWMPLKDVAKSTAKIVNIELLNNKQNPPPILKKTDMLKFPKDFFNKIVCGDTLELIKKIPDGAIDLVVTSPPYNLKNSTGNGMKDGRGGKWANAALQNGYTNHDDCMPHGEYVEWQRNCLAEMMRIIPDDGAIFYNHKWRVQGGLLQDRQDIVGGFPVRQIIIWKRKGGFNFNISYFLPTYEVIYLIAKPKFKLSPKANAFGDIWEFTQDMNNPHPAPFPVALIERIISSTNAETILDPFMGSGTTAVVAKGLGRNYIGIDISPEYCKMAEERIERNSKRNEVELLRPQMSIFKLQQAS